MKTVLFIVNHNMTLYNFRRELVEQLVNENYRVIVLLPVTEDTKRITDLGCEVIDVPVERRGTNPIRDFKLFTTYRKILKQVKPDVVLLIQLSRMCTAVWQQLFPKYRICVPSQDWELPLRAAVC